MSIDLKEYFGDYKKSNIKQLNDYISKIDSKVSKYYNFGKPFFKGDHKLNYKEYLKDCNLNYNPLTAEETFEYISPLYQNLPNWNNPGTMINVIPPVNLISLASMSFSELYNPNFAQDTYAGLLITSEMEVTKYISDLLKWNWEKSYGVFTFGGKGTNLYATKIALAKAAPETQNLGCERNKYFMITSENAHPCHYEVCNWLGIGKDNCIEAKCNLDGRINLEETKKVICKNIENGKIFLGFNLNGGSTNEKKKDHCCTVNRHHVMQFYYGAQSDGSVGLVHKFIWKGDAMEGDWYMDGKKTSGNMYETYYKKYHANATWYSFAQSSNNNLIRKELSNTKQKLGM